MPARNVLKIYVEGGIYHIYNRGVEKRDIFLDDSDYKYFLWLLKTYLTPFSHQKGWHPFEGATLQAGAFAYEIELMAYCLMPNHFHLLIRQRKIDSMSKFMKCVATNYSMRFNKKYDRVGKLFQGHYKAILVSDDNYLLHLTRYIHLNPVASKGCHPLEGGTLLEAQEKLEEGWSSYGEYLGVRRTKWVKPEFILDLLNQGVGTYGDKVNSYKDFVEKYSKDSEEILGNLKLD